MQAFQRVVSQLSNAAGYRLASKREFAAAATAVAAEHGAAKELKLILASPTKAIYSNVVVKQIDVPGMASNMGILPIHVPTIAVLKPGILSVYEVDGAINKYFVSSGSLAMNIDGTCQILAEEIAALDDLDSQAAQRLLEESSKTSLSPTSNDVERAEAQIQAEVAEAVMKAASGGGH